MKILHYIPSIDRTSGGVGAYMQLLARPLGRLVELHVATHSSDNELKIDNCILHHVPKLRQGMSREWKRLLDEVKPDVVHVNCCWMPECAMAQRWAQQLGYKVVLTPHGMLEPWIMKRHYLTRKLPALMLYQKAAIKNADCLHATAESEKQNLLTLGYNSEVRVIANGIDVDNIAMKSSWQHTGKLLFLSRVHIKKGVNFLIEAMAQLKDRMRDYVVDIAGEGDADYIDELKRMAEDYGIADRVRFVGGVYGDRKWQLFRDADLFVLPTHSENFGIVVAEALACGTPVVTTKGTPWQELESEHCGWWTEVGTDATIEALKQFAALSDNELETMGRNGRRLVENRYSNRMVANEMCEMYRELMK